MNPIIVIWAILSVIPGAGFFVAGVDLFKIRTEKGVLLPMIFCFCNGVYDMAFGFILLWSTTRPQGAEVWDLVIVWLALYIPARLSSVGLALMLSGQINDEWLRKLLRMENKNPGQD